MSNKKKYEGEKEMAESRKMKTEKGLALVPGANPLADGCNFAVEVPEDSRASPDVATDGTKQAQIDTGESSKDISTPPVSDEKKTEPEMYMQCIFRILI